MLLGQQVVQIGPKNRILVPKKFREELGEELIVAYGYEGALIVFSKKAWEEEVARSISGPLTQKSVREEARFLLSGAEEIELDEQGRFVLPVHLKRYAEIKDEVYFVGLGRWVEIWDSKKWEIQSKSFLGRRKS